MRGAGNLGIYSGNIGFLMSSSIPPFIAFTQRERHSIVQTLKKGSQSNIKEGKSMR